MILCCYRLFVAPSIWKCRFEFDLINTYKNLINTYDTAHTWWLASLTQTSRMMWCVFVCAIWFDLNKFLFRSRMFKNAMRLSFKYFWFWTMLFDSFFSHFIRKISLFLHLSFVETMRRCRFFFNVFGLELPDYLSCHQFSDSNNPDICVGNKQMRDAYNRALKPGNKNK